MRYLMLMLLLALVQNGLCAECRDESRVSNACFDALGWLPFEEFGVGSRVTRESLETKLGHPLAEKVTRGPDPREPEILLETVELTYPGRRFVISRADGSGPFWIERYESSTTRQAGSPCAVGAGQKRAEVARVLGLSYEEIGRGDLTWFRYWCEGDENRAAHATLEFAFTKDQTLERITWSYWSD